MSQERQIDDFTRDMMTHFLNEVSSTLPKIEALSPEDWVENLTSWKNEALSNQFPHFSNFLDKIISEIQNSITEKTPRTLKDYTVAILTYVTDLGSGLVDNEKWQEKNWPLVTKSPALSKNKSATESDANSLAMDSDKTSTTTPEAKVIPLTSTTNTKSSSTSDNANSNHLKSGGAVVSLVDSESGNANDSEKHESEEVAQAPNHLFLICFIGKQEFILPVQAVIEVSSFKNSFPLPEPREGIEGLVNFRGEAIPIVNLNDHDFNLNSQTDPMRLLVVCEHNESRFALRISKTDEVIEVDTNTFQKCEDTLASVHHQVITHFFIYKNRTVFNFDIKRLFVA